MPSHLSGTLTLGQWTVRCGDRRLCVDSTYREWMREMILLCPAQNRFNSKELHSTRLLRALLAMKCSGTSLEFSILEQICPIPYCVLLST